MAERKNQNLKEIIDKYIEVSQERILAAENLYKDGLFRDSISRAYYAMLDICNAVLLTKGLEPKSHAGSIRLFSLHFIKTGIISDKFSAMLSRIEDKRAEADYTQLVDFTKDDAERILAKAKEFVSEVKSYLERAEFI